MNIEDIVKLILEKTGKNRDEIHELILEKRKKLKMIITEEAAAKLVARDLGIEILTETTEDRDGTPSIKINDLFKLKPGVDPVTVTGVIQRLYLPHTFTRKTGGQSKVLRVILEDETAKITTILWGNHVDRFEKEKIQRGDCIKIIRGGIKQGRFNLKELHVGDYSHVILVRELKHEFPNPDHSLISLDKLTEAASRDKEVDVMVNVYMIFQERTFRREDGKEGSISWLGIYDDSKATSRLVLWNERSQEVNNYQMGDKLLVEGGLLRESRDGGYEIHLGQRTRLTKRGQVTVPDSLKTTTKRGDSSHTAQLVKLKLMDIDNQSSIETSAIVVEIGSLREFTRKDGSQGQVVRMLLYDGTAYLPLVIWNEKTSIINTIKAKSAIKISNAYARNQKDRIELHVSSNGEIEALPATAFSLDIPYTKISEITPDLSHVNVRGKIVKLSDPTYFDRQDGSQGQVRSLQLKDETEEIRIVAWDHKVKDLDTLMVNEAVEIIFGKIRSREDQIELHLTSISGINSLTEVPPEIREIVIYSTPDQVQDGPVYERKQIDNANNGDLLETRAKIMTVYRWIPFFMACPECSRKTNPTSDGTGMECNTHGLVDSKPRLIFTVVADDGHGTLRCVLFGKSAQIASGLTADALKELSDSRQEEEMFRIMQSSMLGKEFIFTGEVNEKHVDQEEESLTFKEMVVRRVTRPDPMKEFDKILVQVEE
ncbi:MAG: OB-fold nucleic acid binding domain-containing protein [Candidatus Hodarchaeales archaeon]|jgi:ssDNA-binding replication factor A large subunit